MSFRRIRFITAVFCTLAFSSSSASAEQTLLDLKLNRAFEIKYVHSIQDFRDHFILHIERVRKIGLRLYDRHPELFADVPRSDVDLFLQIHDQAKVNSSKAFKKKYWVEPLTQPSFMRRLWHKYNVALKDLPEEQKKIAFGDIAKLNEVDKAVGVSFMKSRGYIDPETNLPNRLGSLLLRIERIADVTDRNTDPVAMEELALKEQVSVSVFIKDPDDLKMIEELKAEYEQVVMGARYEDRCKMKLVRELSTGDAVLKSLRLMK